jgi:hypothetical protein
MRSVVVVFPASMCAMMPMLRIFLVDIASPGSATVRSYLRNPETKRNWALTGSNRRHLACKASALPTELSARAVVSYYA